MPAVMEHAVTIWEGSDPEPLARVVGRDEAALMQADFTVSAIDLNLYEENNLTPKHSSTGISVSAGQPGGGAVVEDTLMTGGRWKADSEGYNFHFAIRHEDFTGGFVLEGGKKYLVEFILYTTDWGKIPLRYIYTIKPLYSL